MPLSSARRHHACRSSVSCSREREVFSHSWRNSSRMVIMVSSTGESARTCAVLIEQLRFKAQEHELLPEHKREKTRIMQRILRNDAQIRCLAEPWLAQVEHMFEGQPQMVH